MIFERHSCTCEWCVRACKVQPGMLIPSDLAKIGIMSIEYARLHLVASVNQWMPFKSPSKSGVVIIRHLVPMRVPSFRKKRLRPCHWLVKDRCTIHENAPFGCAYFNACMRRAMIAVDPISLRRQQSRVRWGLEQIADEWRGWYDGQPSQYVRFWNTLAADGVREPVWPEIKALAKTGRFDLDEVWATVPFGGSVVVDATAGKAPKGHE